MDYLKNEILGKCPVCGEDMHVTRLNCNHCYTSIEGDFMPCKFCKLTDAQKHFLEIFIKNRGNIKEMEKDLGISYPTVRNKLEEIIVVLGYKAKYNEPKINKKEILEKLSNGEITSEEALKLLKGENKEDSYER